MSGHTPGPWHIYDSDIYSADDKAIADTWDFAIGLDEAKANMRLIAAAPDLLEALGQTLNAMIHLELSDSSKIEWESSKAAAYAAIAKATGGAA